MTDIIFINLRKILVATLALMFAFVVIYTPQEFNHHETVPMAQAQLGLGGALLVVAAVTAFAVQQFQGILKEFVLDPIAWAIAKQLVAHMVSDLVDWINSGFKGSPAFITNFNDYLLEAADKLAGHYLEKLGGAASFLCTPFKLNIQVALAVAYDHTREDGWTYEGCTLSDIVGNLQDFLDGSFITVDASVQTIDTTAVTVTNEKLQEAWQNWNRVISEPEKYTEYGQFIRAQRLMEAGIAAEKAKATVESNWGNGMKANKTCQTTKDSTGHQIDIGCVIMTPAKQISDALSHSLGAGQNTLITADEISELVGALIAQLGKKAITGAAGLLGLSKGTGYTYGGYSGGSYTGAASAQSDSSLQTAQQGTVPNSAASGNTGGTNTNNTGGAGNTGGTPNTTGLVPQSAATDLNAIADAYITQMDFVDMADKSIAALQAYINNTNNPQSKRDVAQQMLFDAQGTRQNALDLATKVDTLSQEYVTLNAEYSSGSATPQRQAAILAREKQIMATFNTLNLFTQKDINTYRARWSTSTL